MASSNKGEGWFWVICGRANLVRRPWRRLFCPIHSKFRTEFSNPTRILFFKAQTYFGRLLMYFPIAIFCGSRGSGPHTEGSGEMGCLYPLGGRLPCRPCLRASVVLFARMPGNPIADDTEVVPPGNPPTPCLLLPESQGIGGARNGRIYPKENHSLECTFP